MSWTEAKIAQLTRLWREGVSASGIAEAVGDVSRCAVLGKLYRLQLLGSRKPASAPRRYDGPAAPPRIVAAATRPLAQPRRPPAEPPRSPWREAAFAPLAGTAPRAWLSREFGECAFPVDGEGAALVSCCAPTQARSAYCPGHHGIVFRSLSSSARTAEQRRWVQVAERAA